MAQGNLCSAASRPIIRLSIIRRLHLACSFSRNRPLQIHAQSRSRLIPLLSGVEITEVGSGGGRVDVPSGSSGFGVGSYGILPSGGEDNEVSSGICFNDVKDPLQFPSSCEGSSSSVSMDNSRTSSFDLASSMGDINNSLGPEGRHTYDNTNEAIMSPKTNTARTGEHLTSTRNLKAAAPVGVGNGHIVVVDSSKEGNASDKAEKKKKGLLNFIYATADKMAPLNIAFSVFSLYCIFQEHGDITWMRIICGGSGISLFSSFFMIGFAAAFKEGESINHAGL